MLVEVATIGSLVRMPQIMDIVAEVVERPTPPLQFQE